MTAPDIRLPKLCGADVELGNFILGVEAPGSAESPSGTGYEASRALLREVDGVAGSPWGDLSACECVQCRARRARLPAGPRADTSAAVTGRLYDPQDWGRKFLPTNGGCIYVDLDHLELCLPEVRSAFDHLACWHAMLRIARRALDAANERQRPGQRIQALVNNSDGLGNSYGSHLDFLLSRRAWENLFHRKPHHLAFLAAYQASSLVFTGQGKVGSENGAAPATFQLAQRADFLETLTGVQTTFFRPLVNARDEPLCGAAARRPWGGGAATAEAPGDAMARLHVIYCDNTLCQGASLLKVGALQIVLAMLEAGCVDSALALEDPLEAVARFSHDPGLTAAAALAGGGRATAVELQRRFVERARSFVAAGECDGLVPRAGEIVTLWEDTVETLARGELEALCGRLDWVLKLSLLGRALEGRPDLEWSSPEIKHLDQVYSSLDAQEGLHWAMARAGAVETFVGEEEIARFESEPPADTRAFARAALLRRAPGGTVAEVDWDRLRFRLQGSGSWSPARTVELADPRRPGRAELEPLLLRGTSFAELLDLLAGDLGDEEGGQDATA